jgi:two-component system uhpT operon response regulator UhpA
MTNSQRAKNDKTIQVVIVDDHDVVRYGFESICKKHDFELLASDPTVPDCLVSLGDKSADVAVLDLSLADGSKIHDNVRRFVERDIHVLAFSIGDKVAKNRDALRAGAAALITKSSGLEELSLAIQVVASGGSIHNLQTAAAIDSDLDFKQSLTNIERGCLGLLASGYDIKQIAFELNLTEHEVRISLDSVREKFTSETAPDEVWRDPKLSEREKKVLVLYAKGKAQKEVAKMLGITPSTVKEHLDRIRRKYAAVGRPIKDKTDFLKRAIEDGLIDDLD